MFRVRSRLTINYRNRIGRVLAGSDRRVGWFVAPAVDQGTEGGDEVAYRGEGSAANGLLNDDPERDLDELERRIG